MEGRRKEEGRISGRRDGRKEARRRGGMKEKRWRMGRNGGKEKRCGITPPFSCPVTLSDHGRVVFLVCLVYPPCALRSSWLPMAPPGSSWLLLASLVLLAPLGSSWLILAPPVSSSSWLLLAPPGSSWFPPDSSWLLLVHPGSPWLLLTFDVARPCRRRDG